MAYSILFSKEADRGLEKLDQQIRIKIIDYLEKVRTR
jgi:mRNA-degrading endonuclease RelE of RelBE toxin-antitoxin system